MELPFRIENVNHRQVKIRDDGRRGLCIGDEWLLWEAWQEAIKRVEELTSEVAQLRGAGARR